MTFNDNAQIDTSGVQRRRGGAGGKVAVGGGIGIVGMILDSAFGLLSRRLAYAE